MKKVLFFFLVFVCVTPILMSQTVVGAKAGVSLGWFSGSNWDDYISSTEAAYGISISEKPYPALFVGGFVENMFNDNFGIVAELSYTTYGQKYEYTYSNTKYEGEYLQKSLQVPLLLKVAAQNTGGPYAIAGPTLQLLIGDTEAKESGGGVSVEGATEPDNTLIIGGLAGVGYGLSLDSGILSFEARIATNLTDAYDVDPFNINTFQIVVGYGFELE